MTIKIIPATDPIEVSTIVTTIYGQPGGRKTTTAFSSHKPLLLDFDGFAYRAKLNRGPVVRVSRWGDIAQMERSDLAPFRTIIVDTVGTAIDSVGLDAMESTPKLGRAGSPTLEGWGQIKIRFIGWLNMLRSYGLQIVLLAHMEETGKTDDVKERLLASGGSKNEIYRVSDQMGRLRFNDKGESVLLFSPTDAAFGKNPAQFPPLVAPRLDPGVEWLGDIINQATAKINAQNEEQAAVSAALAEWNDMVQKAATPDALNKLLTALDHVDARAIAAAKSILWKHAKEHGMTYDKEGAKFTEKEVTGAPC